MNKKELGLFLAVAAATGFVGGNVGRLGSYVSVAQADQPAQEVVAHRFVLLDDAGNGRAELAVKGDKAYLAIIGTRQQPVSVDLSVDSSGQYMVFEDAAGHPQAGFLLKAGENPALAFIGRKGKSFTQIGPHGVTSTNFELADMNGNKRGSLTLTKDGTAYLGLLDGNGKPRTAMGVSPDGSHADLFFFDPNGNVIATYPQPLQQRP